MRIERSGIRLALVIFRLAAGVLAAAEPGPEPGSERVLAKVGATPITERDLEFMYLSRSVPDGERSAVRQTLLEQLVERRLVQLWLDEQGIKADPKLIDAQVQDVEALIRRNGREPAEVLAARGMSPERLRSELALPAAWQTYQATYATPERVRTYFEAHRDEYDGTSVRVSQILIKRDGDGNVDAARQALTELRQRIAGGALSFAKAAESHSQSPSSAQGGDMGWTTSQGPLGRELVAAAFALEPGELSLPIETRFGLHLITVTGRRPGMLSLEDARRDVVRGLSEERWREVIDVQREKVKVDWEFGED